MSRSTGSGTSLMTTMPGVASSRTSTLAAPKMQGQSASMQRPGKDNSRPSSMHRASASSTPSSHCGAIEGVAVVRTRSAAAAAVRARSTGRTAAAMSASTRAVAAGETLALSPILVTVLGGLSPQLVQVPGRLESEPQLGADPEGLLQAESERGLDADVAAADPVDVLVGA